MTEAYSQVAWDQLDAMEASDPHRYAAVSYTHLTLPTNREV